jgi:hypothetical protein
MLPARSSVFLVVRPRWSLLIVLILALCSGCSQSLARTYSVDEVLALMRTRTAEMANQIQFSYRLDPATVPNGHEIFFVVTLTNTTDLPLVFREPRQIGVLEEEAPGKMLLFSVTPISNDLSIAYPLETGFVEWAPVAIQRDMFTTLPPHSSREFRLQLPHMVRTKVPPATVFSEEYFPLPSGRYRVQMTYYNHDIGYQMKVGNNQRYVDLNAWVGKIEGEPAVLTITPGK